MSSPAHVGACPERARSRSQVARCPQQQECADRSSGTDKGGTEQAGHTRRDHGGAEPSAKQTPEDTDQESADRTSSGAIGYKQAAHAAGDRPADQPSQDLRCPHE